MDKPYSLDCTKSNNQQKQLGPCCGPCDHAEASQYYGCAYLKCTKSVHVFCGFPHPDAESRVYCFDCALKLSLPNMDEDKKRKWKGKDEEVGEFRGMMMTSGETEQFHNQFDQLSQDEEEPKPLSSFPLAADEEDQFSCSPEIPDINSWKQPDLQQLCKRKKIKFNTRIQESISLLNST